MSPLWLVNLYICPPLYISSWPTSDMHCISRLVTRQLAPSLKSRNLHLTAMAPVAVGDKIPSVTLFENSPGNKVELAELCAGKKVL